MGKPVTFTASVSSLAGTPTGKVQFLNGKTVLATKLLTSGSAKFATSTLPPGSSIVTAVYLGDSKNNGSTSAPVNQFVLAATTTTLTSSLNPSKYGQVVTFTAKVTSSIGAPPNGETVTFKKGTTVLGTGTLSGGTATFMTSTLKLGTNSIKAVYGGDSNFAGSTSNVVLQVVNR
jgi:Bacterial Ig-like domain (group 3)